jgi:hypothetical protein
MLASLAFGSPALAQDDPPVEDVPVEEPVVVTEPPAPDPTEPPPPPPPPTEAPLPTEPPVIVEPTLAPTDPPLEPTAEPTAPPTGIPASPTIEPTATSTPTPTPEVSLTYALASAPECTLAPDQAAAVASGGAIDYACTSTLALNGTQVIPANVAVTWSASATIGGGWSVQVLPPQNDPQDVVEWTPAGATEARFDFVQRNPAGTAAEPGDLATTTTIGYRLRVQRPTCSTEAQTFQLQHDVAVQSPDAPAEAEPTAPRDPLRITPDLQAIPEPAVAFDGALDFGEVSLSASGLPESTRGGSLGVVVSNLNQTCGEWTVRVSASALADQAGVPLPGSSLVVVSINGEAVPDGGCDLANGCDLATLTGNPDALETQTIALGVELRMPEAATAGAFQTTLDAVLTSAGTTQAFESPQAASEEEGREEQQ